MNSTNLDARDSLLGWMRRVNKRLDGLERSGRIDLLSNTVDGAVGRLTVRQLADIPTDLPDGTPVYVVDEDADYEMDPVTRQWQPADS